MSSLNVRLGEHLVGNAIQHEGRHEIKISGLKSFFELLDGIELWRHGWDVGILEKGGWDCPLFIRMSAQGSQ
jgi:hypothetical protein